MFSRTTTASSMRRPMASDSAEQRHHVEREVEHVHQEEGGDDEVGSATALISVERRSSMKTRMTRMAIAPPKTMCDLDLVRVL
jgi:hypothetical protein